MTGSAGGAGARGNAPAARAVESLRAEWRRWLRGCAISSAAIALTVLLLRPWRLDLGLLNIALLLLLLSVVSAAAWGWVVGLCTAIVSNLAFNFFFVPPLYRLSVQQPDNALALAIFLLVAAITAGLLAQRRQSAHEAGRRAAESEELLLRSRRSAQQAERRANETQMLLALNRTTRDHPLEVIPELVCASIVHDFGVLACTLYSLDAGALRPVAHAGAGDAEQRRVWRGEQEVHLTPTEYDLLKYLVQHADKALTHGMLLRAVWGPEYMGESQYLRVYVPQLRRKIEADPARPQYILTEPGVGYRFQTRDD